MYKVDQGKLNDFLYEQGYETWLLQTLRLDSNSHTTRLLRNSIMGIHTAETITPCTPDWSAETRQALGQKLLRKLAEDILNLYDSIPVRNDSSSSLTADILFGLAQSLSRPADVEIKALRSQLEIDGFLYRDRHLYPSEKAVIDTVEQRTELERLVDSVPIKERAVIKHHIEESEKAYADNRWGHSISDARNFLEAILREIAAAHHLKTVRTPISDAIYNWPVKVREYLLVQGLIDKAEQEALWKCYGLISRTGSHPNIAEREQARLMRHLALTFSQYMLLQWEGYLKNNP